MLSTEDANLCHQRIHSLESVMLGFHIVSSRYSEDRGSVVNSDGIKVGTENWSIWNGVSQEDLSVSSQRG